MKRVLAIDPSINEFGWAVFIDKKLVDFGLIKPSLKNYSSKFIYNKNLKGINSFDFVIKSEIIYKEVNKIINQYKINCLVLEMPQYWAVGGFISRESGAMSKLHFLCGYICSINVDEFVILRPHEWKGQLSKKVVKNRLNKKIDKISEKKIDSLLKLNHNILDAIGLGYKFIFKEI